MGKKKRKEEKKQKKEEDASKEGKKRRRRGKRKTREEKEAQRDEQLTKTVEKNIQRANYNNNNHKIQAVDVSINDNVTTKKNQQRGLSLQKEDMEKLASMGKGSAAFVSHAKKKIEDKVGGKLI